MDAELEEMVGCREAAPNVTPTASEVEDTDTSAEPEPEGLCGHTCSLKDQSAEQVRATPEREMSREEGGARATPSPPTVRPWHSMEVSWYSKPSWEPDTSGMVMVPTLAMREGTSECTR